LTQACCAARSLRRSPALSSRVIRRCASGLHLASAGFTRSSSTGTVPRRTCEAERAAIYTRAGYDWTLRFQPIAHALPALPADNLILDGEAVVADTRGIPDFGLPHAGLAAGRKDRLLYYAFDLLYLDGVDLRGVRLAERKRVLAELLAGSSERILYTEHLEGDGPEIHERACAMGLEGIISNQQDAPYRSGRTESWIKVKCGKRGAFPIVAFVEKLGAKPRRIASLYIGRREGDRLLYAGKVRSGYTEAVARDLRERLDPFIRKDPPLSEPVKRPKATWVEPVIEAEVAYSTVTENNLLREAVFKGMREDRDVPVARTRGGSRSRAGSRPTRIGVPRENILQLLPDAVAPSKQELAAYWTKIWKRALEHLGRRPLKLVRNVKGTTFYHMGKLPPVPEAVHRLTIEKREGSEGTRLWVDDLAGLLGLVEIGVVELHPWNASVDEIEHPDMLVFDLDPGEGVAWDFVTETALMLRRMLKDEGLEPWPKLTGARACISWRRSTEPSTTTGREPTPSESPSASPRRHRTATCLLLHPVSAPGASSSTTCGTAAARRQSAPGRRGRGRASRSRPR
jgi:bifunctional non-homologous end joining protein LigD